MAAGSSDPTEDLHDGDVEQERLDESIEEWNQNRIEALEEELKTAKNKIKEQNTVAKVQSAIEEWNGNRIEELEKELKSAKNKIEEQNAAAKLQSATINLLSQSDSDKLSEARRRAKEADKVTQRRIGQLEEIIGKKDAELSFCEEERRDLKGLLATEKAVNVTLRTEVKQAERVNGEKSVAIRDLYKRFVSEKDAAIKVVKNETELHKALLCKAIANEKASVGERIAELNKEVEKLKQEKTSAAKEAEKHKAAIIYLEKAIESKKLEIKSREEANKALKKALASEEDTAIKDAKNEKKLHKALLSKSIADKKASAGERIAELSEEVKKLKQEKTNAAKDAEKHKAAIIYLERAIESKKLEIKSREEENKALKKALASEKEAAVKVVKNEKELHKALFGKAITDEKASAGERIAELSEEVERLKQEIIDKSRRTVVQTPRRTAKIKDKVMKCSRHVARLKTTVARRDRVGAEEGASVSLRADKAQIVGKVAVVTRTSEEEEPQKRIRKRTKVRYT